jgi:hypothetical protein
VIEQTPLSLHVAFRIGDIVHLAVDVEETSGMITGYHVRPDGISYYVGWPHGEDCHFDIELRLVEEEIEDE